MNTVLIRRLWRVLLAVNGSVTPVFSLRLATSLSFWLYRLLGVKFVGGNPNYISPRTKIDGTDYSLVEIGRGVTISSYIRILTHDWALHTLCKAMGHKPQQPVGRIAGVSIGEYSFVGTGSIIMPGTTIGRGCLIAAGTVVRGAIPDYSIVMGGPGQIVGDSRDYVARKIVKSGLKADQQDLDKEP